MDTADRQSANEALEPLLAHPLLRGLAAPELRRLTPHLIREEHPRGACVFRRGEPGDAFYVILDGQVAIESPLAGRSALLALCGPGEWFGELAVLTGAPRSADARVEVDATLLRIDRVGWTALSLEAPHVFALLCERLSRQLAATNQPRPRARRTVAACEEADGWESELAGSLERQFPGRPVHVIGPTARRAEAARALAGIAAPDALVLLVGGAELAPLADRRVRRAGPSRFVLTPGRHGRTEDIVGASDGAAAIDRVARHLAGGVIGLALGAGGAYGLSHLGVLRVLDDAKIPIDCVAGTSMGAIIGAGLAAGVPLHALESLTARVARDYVRLALRDLDLRGPALLRGDAPRRLLEQLEPLASARCAELTIPFAAVAMDLRTGEAVELRSGSLLDAIQPSYAMPMIFPPCPRGSQLLVDGAMASPVPVETARALGADFVIAAQPIPPLADAPGASPHVVRQALDWLPLGRVRNALRTLDVSIRSFQSLWHQLARTAAASADAAIEPELAAYSFLQFGAGPEIVAAGRRAADAALPDLRTRLSEAVGWAGSAAPGARSASSS